MNDLSHGSVASADAGMQPEPHQRQVCRSCGHAGRGDRPAAVKWSARFGARRALCARPCGRAVRGVDTAGGIVGHRDATAAIDDTVMFPWLYAPLHIDGCRSCHRRGRRADHLLACTTVAA